MPRPYQKFLLSIFLVVGGGHCAAVWGQAEGALPAWRIKILDVAATYLAEKKPGPRNDCSSLVTAILDDAGIKVSGNSASLWHAAEGDGRLTQTPLPGDLAFFDFTYDANANGKVDDELTHVALITAIDADGLIVMVHFGSGETREMRMDLRRPDVHRAKGRLLNDFLRAKNYGDENTPRLAGQLFRGFARVRNDAR